MKKTIQIVSIAILAIFMVSCQSKEEKAAEFIKGIIPAKYREVVDTPELLD